MPDDLYPEMDVKAIWGPTITDGDTTPSFDDFTDFGGVQVAGGTYFVIFVISNTGELDLSLTGDPLVAVSGANASDFTVTAEPTSPVTALIGSTTFTVVFDPSGEGLRTATISIDNDDPDEKPYDFAIQGTGFLLPDIDVQGNNISIAVGDLTPDTSNGTDFGSTPVVGGTVPHTFTIINTGDGNLNLSDNPYVYSDNTADFNVTLQPTSPIAPAGSTTFTVEFDPSASGLRTAVIGMHSDDPDEPSYYFRVQGIGEAAPGSFNKLLPADGQTGVSLTPTLSWESSTDADYYEYCYDTSDDGSCGPWVNNGTTTSITLPILTAGGIYYWQVRAVNDLGTTYANDTTIDYWLFRVGAAPDSFIKLNPENGAENQATSLTLSWSTTPGEVGYAYCYDQTNDDACTGWVNVGTGTSAPISGLAYGVTYYWQVRATNDFGTTYADTSTYWSFTVGSLPGAFNKLSPPDGAIDQATSLTLSWSISGDATGYEYCYDTSDDDTCSTWLSTGTTPSVGLSGLSYGTTYYWQVRANNSFGTTYANGGETAYWSFTVGSLPGSFGKSLPANLATGQATSLTLSWGTSVGATSYEYCYATTTGCTSWTSTGTATSVGISSLAYGTTYFWQVRAVNTFGETLADGGSYWSFTVGSLPGAFGKSLPANLATGQPTSLTLSWGTSVGATSYEYCYATGTGCTSWTSTGTATSVGISSLAYGTTYYWQVRAVNTFGETLADGGSYWSFTVGSLPGSFGKSLPANLATGQATSLTLSWGTSVGATSYEYCYATTTGCTSWTSTGAATSVGISSLAYGTTYYWQVRAVNTFGETLADGGAYWSFTVGSLPGTFGKSLPANLATGQLTSLTLDWGDSNGAASYAYCYALTTGCTNWTSTGAATSASISGLSYGATYYWQVKAVNTFGETLADGGVYWSFTVGTLPGAFSKTSPADTATNQPTSLTLTWAASAGATDYEYCYDTSDDDACTTWLSTGATPSAGLSGLSYATIYYWQVRATNNLGTTYANTLPTAFWSFSTAYPEMDVRGNSISIVDGDGSPSSADGTDFGAAAVQGAIVLHTFTIHNTGLGDLILTGSPRVAISGTAAADFTVSVLPSSVVAPGGLTSFTVVFNPSALGTRSAVLSIANNDLSENPYNFSIQGTGIAAPEMEVRYSTLQIYDGDDTPSEPDGTDFGALPVASGTVTHTFTINNLGDATLNLTGNPRVAVSGDNAADFSVTVQPSSSVAAGGSTTFTVVFNPSASGLRSASLSIANNDANENPYNFNIQGTGVNPPAAFTKLLPANGATEVSTSPTLSWSASTQVSRYEYCIDTTPDNTCSTWIDNGTATSVGLSGLSSVTAYYWHVRAVNIAGTTYADGSGTAFWSFTTTWSVSPDFFKNTPLNNALDQPVDITLTWGVSAGASTYEYCIDTSDDDACTTWINVGNTLSVALTGLREETTYYWQVRANNSGQVIYAGGSATAFWGFTTGDFFVQMYLPVVQK